MLTAMQGFLPDERITRLRNLALLASGLFLSESAHLSKIVRTWPLAGRLVSLTNRLRRFLKNESARPGRLYRPVARKLLSRFEEPWQTVRLILDTTKVGAGHRILTVSLAYRKRALPLLWSVHRGRKGHTGVEKQIALLRRLKPLLPEQSTVSVVGDSEFSSAKLLRWLSEKGFEHVLRTGGHCKVRREGKWRKLSQVPLEEGQTRRVGAVRFTEQHDYQGAHLVMHWAEGEDEPWYLLSSRPVGRAALERYEKRMWTEELYADLKGHGVDLEATGLVHSERISRLVLGACWMYVWLLVLGSYVVKRGWRHLVDRKSRRDKSYFRIGWDSCAAMYTPRRPHQATLYPLPPKVMGSQIWRYFFASRRFAFLRLLEPLCFRENSLWRF